MRRGRPKPIRWSLKPENTHEWETSIQDWCDKWDSTKDTTDATQLQQRLQHLGAGRPRRTSMAQSQLENDLKQKIACVDISEGFRTKLRQQIFQEQQRIAWAWSQRLQNRAAHARTQPCSVSRDVECSENSGSVASASPAHANAQTRSASEPVGCPENSGSAANPRMLGNSDSPTAHVAPPETAQKDFWREAQVQLPPKMATPIEFKLLRPISLLVTSCKALSRVFLEKAESHDVGSDGVGKADMAMQGFRRGFQCADFINCLRSVVGKAAEWSVPVYISQVDFARSHHSMGHPAIKRHATTSAGSLFKRYATHRICVCTCRLADATESSDRRPPPGARSVRWSSGGCWRTW